MPSVKIFTREDGSIQFLHDDEVADVLIPTGEARIERASHVEPDPESPGIWTVDLRPRGGAFHTGFKSRSAALEFEKEWLESNALGKLAK